MLAQAGLRLLVLLTQLTTVPSPEFNSSDFKIHTSQLGM